MPQLLTREVTIYRHIILFCSIILFFTSFLFYVGPRISIVQIFVTLSFSVLLNVNQISMLADIINNIDGTVFLTAARGKIIIRAHLLTE